MGVSLGKVRSFCKGDDYDRLVEKMIEVFGTPTSQPEDKTEQMSAQIDRSTAKNEEYGCPGGQKCKLDSTETERTRQFSRRADYGAVLTASLKEIQSLNTFPNGDKAAAHVVACTIQGEITPKAKAVRDN